MERNRTSGTEVSIDMNGRMCEMCGTPLPERLTDSGSDRSYVQRRDCGNQSIFEHPENLKVPLVQFTRSWAQLSGCHFICCVEMYWSLTTIPYNLA